MPTRYLLYWFDVEDTTVTQSDDATKKVCQTLLKHGVRGTMKVVGQKLRLLRERVRYDVIDALEQHCIGYHTDMHGGRPQPAEYMGPLPWLEGQAEFQRREQRGVDEIRSMFGCTPACYGQPGPNWSPYVFPVLRQWGIPSYVSAFGYVHCHAQPFYYGGIVNMSHLHGTDTAGRQVQHAFGLNFELGTPGAYGEHQRLFSASYEALAEGGLMSIMNHPVTLVIEDWFTTDLKPRELRDAGYEHFDRFVAWAQTHDTRTITAEDLPRLYPDRARHRVFSREELLALARGVGEQVYYQSLDGLTLSAAEILAMLTEFLAATLSGDSPAGAVCEHYDGPALPAADTISGFTATLDEFVATVRATPQFLRRHGRLPDFVPVGERWVSLEDYLVALARVVATLLGSGSLPHEVPVIPAHNALAQHVDAGAYESACRSVMMRPGFSAPRLLEGAYLQAWTLKPAVLSGRLA